MNRDRSPKIVTTPVIMPDGKTYSVPKIGPREISRLNRWLAENTPNPKAEVRKLLDGLSDAVAMHVWDHESAKAAVWPPTLGNDKGAVVRLVMEPDGQVETLMTILGKTLLGFTEADAEKLAAEMDMDDFDALWKAALPGDRDVAAGTA